MSSKQLFAQVRKKEEIVIFNLPWKIGNLSFSLALSEGNGLLISDLFIGSRRTRKQRNRVDGKGNEKSRSLSLFFFIWDGVDDLYHGWLLIYPVHVFRRISATRRRQRAREKERERGKKRVSNHTTELLINSALKKKERCLGLLFYEWEYCSCSVALASLYWLEGHHHQHVGD